MRLFTPSPTNSMLLYSAPSTPIWPIMVKMTSLPEQFLGRAPVSSNLMAEGTLNHAVPVAIPAAMFTTPVAVNEFQKAGFESVFDKDRIAIVLDHFVPNKAIKAVQLPLGVLQADVGGGGGPGAGPCILCSV